jgi:hypothetical protein
VAAKRSFFFGKTGTDLTTKAKKGQKKEVVNRSKKAQFGKR